MVQILKNVFDKNILLVSLLDWLVKITKNIARFILRLRIMAGLNPQKCAAKMFCSFHFNIGQNFRNFFPRLIRIQIFKKRLLLSYQE